MDGLELSVRLKMRPTKSVPSLEPVMPGLVPGIHIFE